MSIMLLDVLIPGFDRDTCDTEVEKRLGAS